MFPLELLEASTELALFFIPHVFPSLVGAMKSIMLEHRWRTSSHYEHNP